MQPSAVVFDLIKKFEGLRLAAYRDPVGIWSIGWGHTRGVCEGNVCTPAQAEVWLELDVNGPGGPADLVNKWIAVPCPDLSQNQFDALVDFCFNIGPGIPGVKDGLIWLKDRNGGGRGVHSTLMRCVLAGGVAAAAAQFLEWDKSSGIVMPGLVARRQAERDLFLS